MNKKTVLIAGMILSLVAGGCGSAGKASESYAPAYSASSSFSGMSDDSSMKVSNEMDVTDAGETVNLTHEKLIRTINMRLQTMEFDRFLEFINGRIAEFGGYIGNSRINGNAMNSTSLRSASLTIRVPQSRVDEFLSGLDEKAKIVTRIENTENVTLSYADTESRLKSLQIEQERFMELLSKAEDMDSIIAIESHLTDLRYQIESYASQLRVLDDRVDYATVTMDINEVKRVTEVEEKDTVLVRMKYGFLDSCYDIKEGALEFLVWFTTNILYLCIWGGIIYLAFRIVRKVIKKRKARRNPSTPATALQEEKGAEVNANEGRVDTEK